MSIIAYDAGKTDGRTEALTAVLDIIEEIAKNPPMRGDLAVLEVQKAVEGLL